MRRILLFLGCSVVFSSAGCSLLSGLDDLDGTTGGPSTGGDALVGGGQGSGGEVGGGGDIGGGGAGGQGGAAVGPFVEVRPVSELNTAADEDDPTFTSDGLELFFNSDRYGSSDIWRADRPSRAQPWTNVAPVSALNGPMNESNPVISPDGLTIWFVRLESEPRHYVSRRANRSSDFTPPILDPQLPGGFEGRVGAVTADLRVMMTYRPGIQFLECRRSNATDAWGQQMPTTFLDSTTRTEAWLSPNGLSVFWASLDLFMAVRTDRDATFSGNVMLEFEPAFIDERLADPWLTPDLRYIMFAVGEEPRNIFEARR